MLMRKVSRNIMFCHCCFSLSLLVTLISLILLKTLRKSVLRRSVCFLYWQNASSCPVRITESYSSNQLTDKDVAAQVVAGPSVRLLGAEMASSLERVVIRNTCTNAKGILSVEMDDSCRVITINVDDKDHDENESILFDSDKGCMRLGGCKYRVRLHRM